MKYVFAVTTNIPTKNAFVWWPAEFDVPTHSGSPRSEPSALDWINDTLVEDGSIRCTKFELDQPDQGERVIRSRVPMILGQSMVGLITPIHMTLREPPQKSAA